MSYRIKWPSIMCLSIGVLAVAAAVCSVAAARDMTQVTGLTVTARGWSRGQPEEEKEVGGWAFYNCPPGRYEEADTRFVIFEEYQEIDGEQELDAFLKLFRKLYLEEYPRARFQYVTIAGTPVEVAFTIDDEGDTLFTLNLPVGNRVISIVGARIGRCDEIPADVRRFLEGIQPVKTSAKKPAPPVPVKAAAPSAFTASELMAVATVFRDRASSGFADAVREFQGDQAFEFMFSTPEYRMNADAWALVFTGSYLLCSRPDQTRPITAFYNPLYDAAVLVRWTHLPGGGVGPDSATLVTGRLKTMPDGGGTHVPQWLKAPSDPNGALQAQTAGFIAEFDRRYPASSGTEAALPGAASEDLVKEVFGQCRLQLESLVAFQSRELKPMRSCLNGFRLALIGGDPGKLNRLIPLTNPVRGKELAALPVEWRGGLAPMFIMPSARQISVILGDANIPGWYLNVCITKSDTPELSSVGVMVPGDISGGAK
ncbi:MAG TPA: hypothetical protein PLV45_12135 [bacterium]|nr:hypothetical protein [bacterium]